jgi:hypothetical protein
MPLQDSAFNDLAKDRRISWIRKALYVVPMILLIGALLLPESILAVAVAAALPVVGPLADLPADVVLDWALLTSRGGWKRP